MHKQLQNLITLAKAILWITDGEAWEPKKYVIVYYHGRGLRVRNCTHTIYPLSYNKNANQKPGPAFAKNFNKWTRDIREELLPVDAIMDKQVKELKSILTKSIVNK